MTSLTSSDSEMVMTRQDGTPIGTLNAFSIGADGKVHNARVVKSIALLDQAALDAVSQWEFEPSRHNGAAVAVTMVIIVTFALL